MRAALAQNARSFCRNRVRVRVASDVMQRACRKQRRHRPVHASKRDPGGLRFSGRSTLDPRVGISRNAVRWSAVPCGSAAVGFVATAAQGLDVGAWSTASRIHGAEIANSLLSSEIAAMERAYPSSAAHALHWDRRTGARSARYRLPRLPLPALRCACSRALDPHAADLRSSNCWL